jgi:hypothetical protein
VNLHRVKALREEIEELRRTDQSLRLIGDRIIFTNNVSTEDKLVQLSTSTAWTQLFVQNSQDLRCRNLPPYAASHIARALGPQLH